MRASDAVAYGAAGLCLALILYLLISLLGMLTGWWTW
jgi:hypothetical protein